MIIVEIKDGLKHTYSDKGVKIERDGHLYCEAYDPVDSARVYTETDIPVPKKE